MITKAVVLGTTPDTGVRAAATSFDDAYPGLYRSAYRVAYRLLGGREESADIAQEACARAYARWGKVSGYDSPAAWVTRVSGNLAIDLQRRRRTAARHRGEEQISVGPDAERLDLHAALLALPRKQREVVLLRFVADQSEAAVAAALGCPVGTVKSQASRGLAALRIALGKDLI